MTESNLTEKRLIRAHVYREMESIVVEKAMQGSGSRKLTSRFYLHTGSSVCEQEVGWDYKPSSLCPVTKLASKEPLPKGSITLADSTNKGDKVC